MADAERYARIKEIFQSALALDQARREAYLREACGGDDSIRREVDSLLESSGGPTILAPAPPPQKAGGKPQRSSPSSMRNTVIGTLLASLFATRLRRWTIAAAGLAGVAGLGFWTYDSVRQTLIGVIGNSLAASRDTVHDGVQTTIRMWIDNARYLGSQPALTADIEDLLTVDFDQPGARALATARPSFRALNQRIENAREYYRFHRYLLADRFGRPFATDYRDVEERALPSTFGMGLLGEVISGRTRFIAAAPRSLRANDPREGQLLDQHWVATPIRGRNGKAIAVLALSWLGRDTFDRTLRSSEAGASADAYLIDAQALLITRGRFAEQMEKLGYSRVRKPDPLAIAHVWARDPGGDLTRGFRPADDPSTWPPTRPAANAIARRYRPEGEAAGVIVEPYRDYRGVARLGGWRWLPEHDIGLIVEVDASEAFAPLRHMSTAFAVLIALAGLALAIGLGSLYSLSRTRRQNDRVKEAGQYTLVRKLGQGGMGEVYLARHALLKRPAAIKIMRAEHASAGLAARFQQEVLLASGLTNPNTVQVYDFGATTGGLLYFAMEYLPGLNLAEVLERSGPLPANRAVFIIRQICDSLSEAHGLGIIHRDIKPHNVMLCRLGGHYDVVKVLDFGLAKALGDPASQTLLSNVVAGTPAYLAPERIQSPERVDGRSDIYSLGVLAFTLLTGREPFEPGSALFRQIMEVDPPRLPVFDTLPAELTALVFDCMAKRMEDRPSNARVVMERMNRLEGLCEWTEAEAAAWWRNQGLESIESPAADTGAFI